jgi:hypothetical protein
VKAECGARSEILVTRINSAVGASAKHEPDASQTMIAKVEHSSCFMAIDPYCRCQAAYIGIE